jgi:hypothetical protein
MPKWYLILLVASLLVPTRVYSEPRTLTTAKTSNEIVTATETDPLDLWLERLAFQESSGRETVDIIDSNGRHSRGCLQFQDATLKEQADKYRMQLSFLPNHPRIATCASQTALAKAMLQDNPAAWKHWRNSTRRIGLPPLQDI